MFPQPRKDPMGQSFPITTVTSAWGAPAWTRRAGGRRSWCPVQTVDALVSVALLSPCAVDQELFHSHSSAILSGAATEGRVQKWWWWFFECKGIFRLFWLFFPSWVLRTKIYVLGSRGKGQKKVWACVCLALPRGGYFLVCVVRTTVRQCGNSWRQRQYASSYRVMCTSQKDVLFCGSAWGKPEECGDMSVERAAIPGSCGGVGDPCASG